MSEWNSVISVLGTLGGTIIGLLIGYWTSSRIEARKEKHEKEMEYRKELLKHMDDIIKPLYDHVQELWSSLASLRESVRMKTSIVIGETLLDLVNETNKVHEKLQSFCNANSTQIDLLMPHPLSTWVFVPIEEKIYKILYEISQGKEPSEEAWLQAINALMKYQKNLKKLIGYETEVRLDRIYPFTTKK
jgi:hypothetical protein